MSRRTRYCRRVSASLELPWLPDSVRQWRKELSCPSRLGGPHRIGWSGGSREYPDTEACHYSLNLPWSIFSHDHSIPFVRSPSSIVESWEGAGILPKYLESWTRHHQIQSPRWEPLKSRLGRTVSTESMWWEARKEFSFDTMSSIRGLRISWSPSGRVCRAYMTRE